MTVEQELSGIDFSRFSKVQDSLLARINNLRAMKNLKNDFMRNNEVMSDEELEEVAAAGNPNVQKNNYPTKNDYPPKLK
ncbi:MAG: hypothetical protein IJU91_06050 [Selenomonadaceae bacterium]|nr:hypothetical protein [Selenomonadaceae bacterium]